MPDATELLAKLMADYGPGLDDLSDDCAIWIGGAASHSGMRDPDKVYLGDVRRALRPETPAPAVFDAGPILNLSAQAMFFMGRPWFLAENSRGEGEFMMPVNDEQTTAFQELLELGYVIGIRDDDDNYGYRSTAAGRAKAPVAQRLLTMQHPKGV